MDALTVVIITAIVTIAATSILFVYVQSRKNGETQIPWDRIRPILSEMFIEAIKLIQARTAGYQGIEDYAVGFVKRKIDSADFLTKEEKELLTADFIRSIISPRLKELYSKEISTKRIGE